jgi:broad-specificity NMP kinase
MYEALLHGRDVILECVAIPRFVRSLLRTQAQPSIVIELRATATTRTERLRARGEAESQIAEWLRPLHIGYGNTVDVATVIDTDTLDAYEVAERVKATIERGNDASEV